jgi:hypothetical protein
MTNRQASRHLPKIPAGRSENDLLVIRDGGEHTHRTPFGVRHPPDMLDSMITSSDENSTAPVQSPYAIDDYGHALVHLAWYRADRARYLLFGFVELYPGEFPAPPETPEKNLALKRLGNKNRLYLKRSRMTAKAALAWYLRCVHGTVELPDDFAPDGGPKSLAITQFVQEPQWPQLITVCDTIPFISQFWQSPQVHHLLQPDLLPDARAAISEQEGLEWLSEQMFVDFNSHSELLGSMHLIAPDPILRGVDHRLSTTDPDREVSVLRFHPRAGKTLEGLRISLIDRRLTGVGSIVEAEVTSTAMDIGHPEGTTGELEMIVFGRAGAVLSWSKPTGFMRSVGVNVMLPGPQQTVVVPAAGGAAKSSYTRVLVGHTTTITAGEPRSPREAIPLLAAGLERRELKRLDDRYPEKWFHGDRESATQFVRSLVSSAKQRIWIVDPYFTTVELVSYALATSSTKLPVLIVTSAEAMTKKDRIDPRRTAAEVLDAQLPNLASHGNFTISVLTGSPAVHDRFLVVDDSVWFSGNSLHTIGDRAGMVVKLRNSGDIIANLEEILTGERVASWGDWMAHWQSTKRQPRRDRRRVLTQVGIAAGIAMVGLLTVLDRNRSGDTE